MFARECARSYMYLRMQFLSLNSQYHIEPHDLQLSNVHVDPQAGAYGCLLKTLFSKNNRKRKGLGGGGDYYLTPKEGGEDDDLTHPIYRACRGPRHYFPHQGTQLQSLSLSIYLSLPFLAILAEYFGLFLSRLF